METLKYIDVFISDNYDYDWSNLEYYKNEAKEVITAFSQYFSSNQSIQDILSSNILTESQKKEVSQVSDIIGIDEHKIAAANLFYDTCKYRCGCTAFAVKSINGPIHGYSLDWDILPEILRKNACLFRYIQHGTNKCFYSYGWPGFLGVLVGYTPNQFSVNLNAVWSNDKPHGNVPIVFAIRNALNCLTNFNDAIDFFKNATLISDCIILLTGMGCEELAVIERTPQKSAIRYADDSFILATNHYCSLKAGENIENYLVTGNEIFGINSRKRYNAICQLLKRQLPKSINECVSLLRHAEVCQDITIFRTVMQSSQEQMIVESNNSDVI